MEIKTGVVDLKVLNSGFELISIRLLLLRSKGSSQLSSKQVLSLFWNNKCEGNELEKNLTQLIFS